MHSHKLRTSVALMVLGTYALTIVPTGSVFVYGAEDTSTTLTQSDIGFSDVDATAWHAAAIAALRAKGAVDAQESQFRPNDNATRAELVSLVLRVKGGTAAKVDGRTGYPFADVDPGTTAYLDLYQAMMQGWFRGDRDCAGTAGCTARPDGSLTRAEASAMLVRAFGLTDIGTDMTFGDVDATAWYAPLMRTLAGRCVLRGDDVTGQDGVVLARPTSNVTRAEMAVLLSRIDSGAICTGAPRVANTATVSTTTTSTTALSSRDDSMLARLLRSAEEGQYLTFQNGRLTWTDPVHSAASGDFQYNPGSGRRPASTSGGSQERHYGGGGTSGGSSGGSSGSSSGGSSGGVTDIWVDETGDTMTGLLRILVDGVGLSVSGTASGDTLFAQKFLYSSGVSIFDGNARFNSTVTLNSVTYTFPGADGSASGKVLKTNGAGQLSWSDDNAVGTGLSQNDGDARYVNTSGDTMTGALSIRVTGGTNTTIGLNVLNTISGSIVHAEKSLTSSGTLIVNGAALLKSTLRILGTASGDVIHAEKSLTTSGTLVFEGAASGASLYLGTSLRGAGLVDCDTSGSSKLLWDSTTGRFSCGSDQTGGGVFSNTGALQNYFDNRYVNTSGDTMTGALTINLSSGTVGLNVLQTISGAVVHGAKTLSTSGTLVFEGAASGSSLFLGTSLRGAGLFDCDAASSKLLWDTATGRFSCGTDQTAASGLSQTDADLRYVNTSGDTMTGTLVFNLVGTTLAINARGTISGSRLVVSGNASVSGSLVVRNAISGAALEVAGTASGKNLFATASITGTDLYAASRFAGAGLTDCSNGTTSKLLWNAATKQFSCGTDQSGGSSGGGGNWSGTGALQTYFDNRFVNTSGDTMTGTLTFNLVGTNLAINARGTISGRTLVVSGNASVSGSLTVARGISGQTLEVLGTASGTNFFASSSITGTDLYAARIAGAGLTDCDTAGTSKLLWSQETKTFSCGTDAGSNWSGTGALQTYFDNRYVNTSGDTMTGALTVNATISGRTLIIGGNGSFSGSLRVARGLTGTVIEASTLSGTNVFASSSITGTDLYAASRFAGAGLTSCSNTTTSKLLWNSATKQFSCGTDTDTNTQFSGTGALQGYFDNRYVNTSGDTMTGTLVFNLVGTTLAINARGTISGRTLIVSGNASVSGSLRVARGISGQTLEVLGTASGTNFFAKASITGTDLYATRLAGAGLTDCDTAGTSKLLWSQETKTFSCGTDAGSNWSGTGALQAYFDNRFVNRSGDNMTGALVIEVQGGTLNSIGLNVLNTLSGAVIRAQKSLFSSGTLTVESSAAIDGTTFVVDAPNNRVGIGTASPGYPFQVVGISHFTMGEDTAGFTIYNGVNDYDHMVVSGDPGFILFETSGQGSVGIGKSSAPKSMLDVAGTISGRTLIVSGNGSFSGSLRVVRGLSGSVIEATTISGTNLFATSSITGTDLYAASRFAGAGLTDCSNGTTSKLLWNSATKQFSCGTDQTGGSSGGSNWSGTGALQTYFDNRFVNTSGDTMTGALVINVTGGTDQTLGLRVLNAVSGAILRATKEITSSGTLIVEGVTTLNGNIVLGDATSDTITATARFASSLIPSATNTYDLGSDSLRWRDLYLSGGTIKLGSSGDETFLQYNSSANRFEINSNGTGAGELVVLSTGDVGIGTSAPKAKLDVIGTISGSSIYSASTITGATIYAKTRFLVADNGTEGGTAPGFSWAEDPDTGLFLSSSQVPGISKNGVSIANFGLSGIDSPLNISADGQISASYFNMGAIAVGTGGTSTASLHTYGGASAFVQPTGSVIFSDTFTEAFNTTLASHTPDTGTSWTSLIQNGAATLLVTGSTDTVGPTSALANAGILYSADATASTADYEVSINLNTVDSTDDVVSLAARIQDSNNLYLAQFSSTATNVELYKRVAGTWTQLGESVYGALAGDTVRLRVYGSQIVVLINQRPVITVSDSSITAAGKAGLGVGYVTVSTDDTDTTWVMDNFQVKEYTTGAGLPAAVLENGYVGIDTRTPGSQLSVSGTAIIGRALGAIAADTGVTLEVLGTISGRALVVTGSVSFSGSLRVVRGISGSVIEASTLSGTTLSARTISGTTLEVLGTASGRNLFASASITGTDLYATRLAGAGLTDCDTAGTSKLLWSQETKTFSCGTDAGSNWSGTGALQTYFDDRFVNRSGDSMTGALSINLTSGYLGLRVMQMLSGSVIHAEKDLTSSGTLTVNGATLLKSTLRILGSASGDTIHAEKSLTTSGTLVFEGAASGSSLYLGTSLNGVGLVDCDVSGSSKLLWDATTGRFSCGTDQNAGAWSGTGALQTYFDNRFVNQSGDTMTGALHIRPTAGSTTVGLNVAATMSGRHLLITGTGAATSPLFYTNVSNGRVGMGTSSPIAKFQVIGDNASTFHIGGGPNAITLPTLYSQAALVDGFRVEAFRTAAGQKYADLISAETGGFSPSNFRFFTVPNGGLNALERMTITSDGRVGIGISHSAGPRTALDVMGTISGTALRVGTGGADILGALAVTGSISTEANLILNADDESGKPVTITFMNAGSDEEFAWDDSSDTFTLSDDLAITDNLFVTRGITGSVLEIVGVASGNILRARNEITSSGSLIVEGLVTLNGNIVLGDATSDTITATARFASALVPSATNTYDLGADALRWRDLYLSGGTIRLGASGDESLLRYNSSADRFEIDSNGTGAGELVVLSTGQVGIGTSTPKAQLDVLGTISGSNLTISKSASISGSLLVKNNIAAKGNLSGSTFFGAGLGDCDTGATSKLLYDITTGKFSCGTDQSGSSGGLDFATASGIFVRRGGGTMTGSLTLTMSTGALTTASGVTIAVSENVNDFAVQGGVMYVASTDSTGNDIRIFDVRNPAVPATMGGIDVSAGVEEVEVVGRYLYAGTTATNEFAIYDISRPSSAVLVSSLNVHANTVTSLTVQGRYAFMGDSAGDLYILDISEPTNPRRVGSLDIGTQTIKDIQVRDRFAYLAIDERAAVTVIDISNPNVPKLAYGASPIGGIVFGNIRLSGRYAYLTYNNIVDDQALRIQDISDPLNPVTLSTLTWIASSPIGPTLAIAGKYAFVGDFGGSMRVIDISNPVSPRFVVNKSIGSSTITGVQVHGNHLYLGTENNASGPDVWFVNLPGVESASATIGSVLSNSVDITDSATIGNSLSVAGHIEVGMGIQATGFSSFTASSGAYALRVIQQSSRTGALAITSHGGSNAPHIMLGSGSTFDVNLYRSAADTLKTDDSFAAAGSISGAALRIMAGNTSYLMSTTVGIGTTSPKAKLDVIGTVSGTTLVISRNGSFSGTLMVVGNVTTRGTLSGSNVFANRSITGTHLYAGSTFAGANLSDCDNSTTSKLLWDISTKKFSCGTDQTGGSSGGLDFATASGIFLKRGGGTMTGTLITNVSTGALKVQSGANVGSDVLAVATNGNVAYVGLTSVSGNDLRIFDVRNSARPTLMGGIDLSASAQELYVAGKYLYIGLSSVAGSDFVIYDVSRPNAPSLVGGVDIGAAVTALYVAGRYAYVGTATNFITVDISNPQSPKIVSTFASTGAYGIYVKDRVAYISNGAHSFSISIDVTRANAPVYLDAPDGVATFIYSRNNIVSGKYIYSVMEDVDEENGSLVIEDISNPASITTISSFGTTADALAIALAGKYAIVGLRSNASTELRIYDVSNPTAPRYVTGYEMGATVNSLVAQGNNVYVGLSSVSGADFVILNLGGLDSHAASIGALNAGGLYVDDNAAINNDLSVGGALEVGQGIQANGPSTFMNSFSGGYALRVISHSSRTGALAITAHGGSSAPHIVFGSGVVFDTNLYRATRETLKTDGYLVVNKRIGGTNTDLCYSSTGALAECSSASRYKEDVLDLGLGLATINALRPVTFKWIGRDEEDLGFIAEEVEQVDDSLVTYNEDGLIQGVKYKQLTAVLTNAVKELDIERLGMQEQIATLNTDVSSALTELGLVSTSVLSLQSVVSDLQAGNFQTINVAYWGTFGSGILLDTTYTNPDANVIVMKSNVGGTGTIVYRVTANGQVYSNSSFMSPGADYAEWFRSTDNSLIAGEVVCIDPLVENAVKRCTRDADTNVMGIVSTNPSFIGNAIHGASKDQNMNGYTLVGLIGQVPAKVTTEGGAIRPGDSLTASSVAGVARKAAPGESTVGVALENFDSEGIGSVSVLISRRNQSLTVESVERKVMDSIAAMQLEDELSLMLQDSLENIESLPEIASLISDQLASINLQDVIEAAVDARVAEALRTLSGSLATFTLDDSVDAVLTAIRSGSAITVSDVALRSMVEDLETRVLNLETLLASGSLLHGAAPTDVDSFTTRQLSISGTLLLSGSGAATTAITASGTTIEIGSLLEPRGLKVLGDLTVAGVAHFLGSVEIDGELTLSSEYAGFAVIPATGTSVTVSFDREMTATPIVTATPDTPVLYAVRDVNSLGFTIVLKTPEETDVTFAYTAVTVRDPKTTRAELSSSSSSEAVQIAFPVTERGVPVSTDAIWNSCVSGYPMILASGDPVNCSRYHEGYEWFHPDLEVTFTYNPNHEPPILLLPEGYAAVVQESSSSSASSESSDSSASSESSASSSSSTSSESSSSSASSESSSSSASEESSSSSSASSESSESSASSESSSSSSSDEGGATGGDGGGE